MAKGKTPKITRESNKFTAKWNPENKYDDQEIRFYVKTSEWKTLKTHSLGKSTDNKSQTITINDYYPGTNASPKTTELHGVGAKLRYKDGGSWSDWGDMGSFDIKVPKPVKAVHVNQGSSDQDYVWSWEPDDTHTKDTKEEWRTYYYWETCLVDAGKTADWSLAKTQRINKINAEEEQSDTSSYQKYRTSTSVTIRENQSDIDARKIRYFHVQALGPEGASSWVTISRPLGSSDQYNPPSEDITYTGENENGTSSGSIPLPVYDVIEGDSIQIEYAFLEPHVSVTTSGNTVTSKIELPSGFSDWQSYKTVIPTGRSGDSVALDLPRHALDNEVLFVRTNTVRNNIINYGVPVLLENGVGSLTKPTLVSFSASEPGNPQELTVTVTDIPALGGGNGVFVAVYCRTSTNMNPDRPIGIIPYSSSEITRTFPATWNDGETVTVGIRSFVADYSPAEPYSSGTTYYSITNPKMQSSADWDRTTTSTLPEAPRNVRVSMSKAGDSSDNINVLVEWDWSWSEANCAEISWSENANAWESTSDPSSYTVTGTRVGKRYVSDLSAGTYYFRVRLIKTENDVTTFGPYSETIKKKISSAPNKPTLILSKTPVAVDEEVTALWGYESTDGTPQTNAMFAEATQAEQDGPYTYTEIQNARPNSAKKYTFTPAQFGWGTGSSHKLSVRTRSGSEEWSEWSNPVTINITPVPTLSIGGIGGPNDALRPLTVSEELVFSLALVKLPLSFTVGGMGIGGQANILIKRLTDYNPVDPTDSDKTAFAGETIFSRSVLASGMGDDVVTVTIDAPDLIGKFDHFANYELDISIVDAYGQTVSANPYEFTVYWDRFSFEPYVEISYTEDGSVLITPCTSTFLGPYSMDIIDGDLQYTYLEEEHVDPDFELIDGDLYLKDSEYYDASIDANGDLIVTGDRLTPVPEGDYCQIYRLSADKPQLIMDHAEFNETYVDQYPTFGQFGGYRVVYISRYGDCVTRNSIAAWTDVIVPMNRFVVSIEFGDDIVEFPGNISLSHQWQKDFQLTKYLGGSVEGDWNPGIERSGSINGTIPIEYEAETMYLLRKLADYSGVCHVRTPEGSNFYADVQVQDDREEKMVNRLSSISLSYTKVATNANELVLYSDWSEE